MSNTNQLVKLGLAALVASMFSASANADVIPGNAVANVIAPLLLVETAPMNFGDVAGGTTGGTMDLTGNRVVGGDANALASGLGTAGQFTIEGRRFSIYTFSNRHCNTD